MKTVFMNPGHGGKDSGNVNTGIREKDSALADCKTIGHYIRLLSKVGDITGPSLIRTLFSREVDLTMSVDTVAMSARSSRADLFVSLHSNSSINSTANGAEVFVCADDAGKELFIRKARILGTDILDRLTACGLKNRGVRSDKQSNVWKIFGKGLKVLRGTAWHMPGVLIETHFASNKHDRLLMSNDESREMICMQIALAIVEFLGIEPRLDLV